MASLTGQLVAETYKALLKTIDNDILTASEKQITDGFGGGSNVFIDSQGFLRANKYKVTNGLATQFLKADGSLDANTYLTGITSSQIIAALGYTPVTNARTLTINGTTYDLSANRSWTIDGTSAVWGNISGTLSNQTDLQTALNAKFNNPSGTISQYIRGDGSIATFPTSGGGGGGGVSYYLNGSINQGTIGGVTYYEMNKVPIIGTGTDFSRNSNGYIASFLTDANDPALLQIPAGNWNFETYLQASNGGGSPSFYIELYKYDGTTFTLIASNSGTPKLINDGANIEAYYSALAVPQTTLTLTDRLAVRIYVNTAGRTITLHTQNGHLCEVATTFSTGISALNGLTAQIQYFATGTSGTDFNISSSTATHTFNLPTASAVNRGALSAADWTTFNAKQAQLSGTGFVKASGTTISYDNSTYLTTADAASTYQPLDADLTAIAALAGTSGFLKKTASDTWALDTNSYLTTSVAASTYQRLDKMVSNLLASDTEYPNSNAVLAKLALKADAENPVFTGNMTISGAEPKLYFTDTDQNPDYFIGADAGFFRIYDQTAGATRFVINSSGVTTIAGDLIVGTIAKSGGTASQFLKADGSIDSSTYVSSSVLDNYLLSATAASTYQRLDKMVSNLLASSTEYPNSNAVIAALALKADAENPVFTGNMTISGAEPKLYFTDTDQNPDYTIFTDSGTFYIYDQTAGATRLAINSIGNIGLGVGKSITAGSFIKDSGTSSQFLKADGSIDSNAYITSSSLSAYLPLAGGTMTGQLTISGLGYGNSLVISTNSVNGADITLINTGTGGKNWHITSTGPNNAMGAGSLQFYNETDLQMVLALSNSRNLLVNTITDSGQRAQISGGAVVPLKLESTSNFSGTEYYRGGTILGFIGTENSTEGLRYNSIQGSFLHKFYSNSALAATISNSGVIFQAGVTATSLQINGGTISTFAAVIQSTSTFAFGSTNGRRIAVLNVPVGDQPGLQFGYDATDNTGIIAGSTQVNGAGLDFYTYDGSAWASRVRIAKNGNTLIGTTTDSGYKFDVNGTGRFTSYVRVEGQYLQVVNASAPSLYLNNTNVQWRSYLPSGTYNFAVSDAVRDVLTLGYNGAASYFQGCNVGIGTSSPSAALTVSGINVGSAIDFTNTTSSTGRSFRWVSLNSGGFAIEDLTASGTNRLTVNPSGYLGIGTTSPVTKLSLNSYVGSRLPYINGTANNIDANGITIGSSNTSNSGAIGGGLDLTNNIQSVGAYSPVITFSSFSASGSYNTAYAGIWGIYSGSGGDANWTAGHLAFGTASSYGISERMRIANDGNLMIGFTTNNSYKLQVNGNTWSNGVRIGRDFSLTNRATVRIDSRPGDNPADILFGRDDAATQTSWSGVYWSISSRGSGEGNEFRIYRGVANTGGTEIVALNINPTAGAVTFINTVTATAFFESSDFRLKTLIDGLAQVTGIENLEAKLYEKNGKIELGYFAQDAEKLMPYAVTKNSDGFLNLSYREVHTAKIARLEKRVAELEKQLNIN